MDETKTAVEVTLDEVRSLWFGDDPTGADADAGMTIRRGGAESDIHIEQMEEQITGTTTRLASCRVTMPGATITLRSNRVVTLDAGRRMASDADTGDYQLGNKIGQGGMGVIVAAKQASLDRRVAVKMIRDDRNADEASRFKFILEALATGSLEHPNIVPIYELGQDENGKLFYAMKEVKGTNWRQVMKKRSEKENIETLCQIANAVASAHAKGILHRDIKSENVMLGDFGEVLLMDWGLAVGMRAGAKALPLVPENALAGTPAYMAPEMARGNTTDIGPWSDQYLLGALLFEILAGKPPHPGAGVEECLKNAANNVIQDAGRNDEWLEVALRAMHSNPVKRYPSVKDFIARIRDCQAHSESLELSRFAGDWLDRAGESKDYDHYVRAMTGFEQALDLWKENDSARQGALAARHAYAATALERGDYELCLSLCEKCGDDDPETARITAEADKAKRARDNRRRLVRVLGVAAAALLLITALVAGGAAVIVSRQAEAERTARQEAETARAHAEEQRARAEAALATAEEARQAEARAMAERLREEQARLEAVVAARKAAEEALAAREVVQRMGYLEDDSRWRLTREDAIRLRRESAERHGRPEELTVRLAEAALPFSWIPEGDFVMGSPPRDVHRNPDEHLHEVSLTKPYYLMRTELTRGQWRAIVGLEKTENLGIADRQAPGAWRVRELSPDEADLPATGISWREAQELFLPAANALHKDGGALRLPTEAEWEWAARAGSSSAYAEGDDADALASGGWFFDNSGGAPHEVGRLDANTWGIHDASGNASEMTADHYEPNFYLVAERNDPRCLADTPMRAVRGGSFVSMARHCRLAARSYAHLENRHPQVGLRLVLAFEPDGGR